MTNNHNDIFAVTQKGLNSTTDPWAFIVQDSAYQKTGTPHSQPIMNRKKCSFIADWEMPQMEKR